MARRTKKPNDFDQPKLPFGTDSQKPTIEIGGNVGPAGKYYDPDAQGNIHLHNSCNLGDPRWGMSVGGMVIVGQSSAMLTLFHTIKEVALCPLPVLIQGLSGTGKELIARAIHIGSSRWDKPYRPVNSGGLPESLLESELFGHVKGAFTGANSDKKGVFQYAHKGTLFLDEIGEMPQSTQVRLLRIVQDGIVVPVGSNEIIVVDVRLISATNRDLRLLVEKRVFRLDLFYRINKITLSVPPLCDRKEDITPLVAYFLFKYRSIPGYPRKVSQISRKALEKLYAYSWAGNVRELESCIEQALIFRNKGPTLLPEDFNFPTSDMTGKAQYLWPSISSKKSSNHIQKRTVRQKRMEELLELIRQNPGVNTKKLVNLWGYPIHTVWRTLRQLRRKKLIKDDCLKDGRVPCYFATNIK